MPRSEVPKKWFSMGRLEWGFNMLKSEVKKTPKFLVRNWGNLVLYDSNFPRLGSV